MRLSEIDRASHLIESVLSDEGDDNLVYLNVMVPPTQKELVVGLAKANRTKQAVVLRTIIDDWCRYKQLEREAT